MLIILEGPDGSGKTHLADRLTERILRMPQYAEDVVDYAHKKQPTADSFLAEYLRPIADYMPGQHRHVILDRWHIGELVYPEMADRQTLATNAELVYLEMFLRSRGALIIHVDTSTTTILERLNQRSELTPLEERIIEQHAGFQRAIRATNVRTVTYDHVKDTGSGELLDTMITAAAAAERDTPHLDLNPTYVGPVRPATVLVGDRRNVREGHFEYPTAFVPEPATSGAFLMSAMPTHWRMYSLFGFINANEGECVNIFDGEVVNPRFVVLGREAEKTVRSRGDLLRFGIVPHPQFIRRFHHHARDRYGLEIQRVADSGEDHSSWRP